MSILSNALPIQYLRPGQIGVVAHVLGAPDRVQRLKELGLREGAPLEMVTDGDACIVRLNGHKLCLRADDFMQVLVEPGSENG